MIYILLSAKAESFLFFIFKFLNPFKSYVYNIPYIENSFNILKLLFTFILYSVLKKDKSSYRLVVIKMTDLKTERLKKICGFLPENLSEILLALDESTASRLCEIRIRSEKPVVLNFTDESRFITESGRLTAFISDSLLIFSQAETEKIFVSLCRCSVHSFEDNIADGFITVGGGCRVGIYGTAVTDGSRIRSVRNVSGLNIRISGEFKGIAEPIVRKIFDVKCENVLICGPPASGKTTVMKDLCRILSDEKGMRVCIVDERGETDGSYTGVNTDVLNGYPKVKGIEIAVRTLSPELIAFDEIGSLEEAEAVCGGMNSGVYFITTVHCRSLNELLNKPQFSVLKERRAVDSVVFLSEKGKTEKIISAKELEFESSSIDGDRLCLCNGRSVHSFDNEQACSFARKNTAYVFGDGKQVEFPFSAVK